MDDMVLIPGPVWMNQNDLNEHNMIADMVEAMNNSEGENEEGDSGLGRDEVDQDVEE